MSVEAGVHRAGVRRRLAEVAQIKHAARRGLALEDVVADLFGLDHFRVQLNPGTARPRQTDLIAIKVNEIYLVECKWRSDKANISDIDGLRSRLRRSDTSAIGILLSYPGFTPQVLADVMGNRSQPIILLSGEELNNVAAQVYTLSDLLWRKRKALLVDGEVLVDEPLQGRRPNKRRLVRRPGTKYEVLWPNGDRAHCLEFGGRFGQFVFADYVADIDWVPAPGRGVTLDIAPRAFREADLIEVFDVLANMGWSTPNARWSIQQSRRNWHGWGSAQFIEELKSWRKRSETEGAHHSEEVCYVDTCDGGFYTVAANLSAERHRVVAHLGISFQFQGYPLDTRPLLELCHTLGVHEGLYFRTHETKSVHRIQLRYRDMQTDSPVALIVAPETMENALGVKEWVTGLVVSNPFRSTDWTPDSEEARELRILEDSEYLVCALAEHHPLDGREYEYHFERVEFARTTDGFVCAPWVNWDRKALSASGGSPRRSNPGDLTPPEIVDPAALPSSPAATDADSFQYSSGVQQPGRR